MERPNPTRDFASRLAQSQGRRRQEALERQREARRNVTDRARRLAETDARRGDHDVMQEDDDDDHSSSSESQGRNTQKKERRVAIARRAAERWWREFCSPEWLVDVPEDLGDWYCVPRPEGKRCLLVASNGKTTSRTTSGDFIHESFSSCLPSKHPTVIEAVFDGTAYHCLDCVSWAGRLLYECSAEFRFFWLRTKLGEVSRRPSDVPLRCVPFFDCDANGLRRAATEATLPFARDGLLFYDKRGYYALGEETPLVLLWKDAATSRYFDVPQKPTPFPFSLRLKGDALVALDDTTVVNDFLGLQTGGGDSDAPPLEDGDLARFQLLEEEPEPAAAAPPPSFLPRLRARFVAKCSPKRPAPDSITKLLVTLRHRSGAGVVTFADLLDHCAPAVPVSPVPGDVNPTVSMAVGGGGTDDVVGTQNNNTRNHHRRPSSTAPVVVAMDDDDDVPSSFQVLPGASCEGGLSA